MSATSSARATTLAALDPTALELAVQAAKAELSNAEAQFANAAASEERQRQLLASKPTHRRPSSMPRSRRGKRQASVERGQGFAGKSQEQLGYARLFSDFDGVVTAVGAEVGQTVSPGPDGRHRGALGPARGGRRHSRPIDRRSRGRHAVPGSSCNRCRRSRPEAKLREIAPQSDGSTRTRRVKLTLTDPPQAFRLGSTVTATRMTKVASRRSSCRCRRCSKRTAKSVDRRPADIERERAHDIKVTRRKWRRHLHRRRRAGGRTCVWSPPASTA
jgi:hypothetical protein